jgi:hypothetical protein
MWKELSDKTGAVLDKVGNTVSNTTKSVGAFLQNGKAPPNTPVSVEHQMASINHLASKKFFIVFTSVILLSFIYYSSIFLLLCIPKEYAAHVTAYVTIFSEMMKVFGLIIASFLGVQTVADFAFNSSSSASTEGVIQSSTETHDITQRIVEEGTNGAPEIKPYSQIATEEE